MNIKVTSKYRLHFTYKNNKCLSLKEGVEICVLYWRRSLRSSSQSINMYSGISDIEITNVGVMKASTSLYWKTPTKESNSENKDSSKAVWNSSMPVKVTTEQKAIKL